MIWAARLNDRRTLFRPFPHRNSNCDFPDSAVTQVADANIVGLSDAEVWSGWRCVAFSVYALQDVTGFDAGRIGRASLEHIQEHPFMFPVDTHIAKAGVYRMLRKQFFGKRMVKHRVARLEFRKKLPHAIFKHPHVSVEQFGGTLIDVLRPGTVVNSCDIDVTREHALLN